MFAGGSSKSLPLETSDTPEVAAAASCRQMPPRGSHCPNIAKARIAEAGQPIRVVIKLVSSKSKREPWYCIGRRDSLALDLRPRVNGRFGRLCKSLEGYDAAPTDFPVPGIYARAWDWVAQSGCMPSQKAS